MNEADLKAIALFFHVALLDDRQASLASVEAANIARDKLKKTPSMKPSIAVIRATYKTWNLFRNKPSRGKVVSILAGGWSFPPRFDLAPWREFQKNAVSEEVLTLIWSHVLNYDPLDVAEALELSLGTVRYRLGRALLKLGTAATKRPSLVEGRE